MKITNKTAACAIEWSVYVIRIASFSWGIYYARNTDHYGFLFLLSVVCIVIGLIGMAYVINWLADYIWILHYDLKKGYIEFEYNLWKRNISEDSKKYTDESN